MRVDGLTWRRRRSTLQDMADSGEVTQLLGRWQSGESQAQEQLIGLVYDELRQLARGYMGHERSDHTLQATALVNEAFLRLLRQASFNDRAHFFRAAAQAMRRILVDHARRIKAGTRIPREERMPLELAAEPGLAPRTDVLALDLALSKLTEVDPDLAQVVELRCFAGLTIPEVAALKGVSEATISREWRMAKGWLRKTLAEQQPESGGGDAD